MRNLLLVAFVLGGLFGAPPQAHADGGDPPADCTVQSVSIPRGDSGVYVYIPIDYTKVSVQGNTFPMNARYEAVRAWAEEPMPPLRLFGEEPQYQEYDKNTGLTSYFSWSEFPVNSQADEVWTDDGGALFLWPQAEPPADLLPLTFTVVLCDNNPLRH